MGALITPYALKEAMPCGAQEQALVAECRREIEAVIHGGDRRFVMIVGPCSIHDYRAAIDYGQRVAAMRTRVRERIALVMRVYFEKPRTAIGWRGLIYDPHLNGSYEIEEGLRTARALLLELAGMGVPAGTEALDPVVPQYIDDLISWASIGARTTESQTHRELASGLSMPVGFKNSTDGNIEVAINALIASRRERKFIGIDEHGRSAIVATKGNKHGHVVLRGGRHGGNYHPQDIAHALQLLRTHGLPEAIIVDCNHGNSQKNHRLQGEVFHAALQQRVGGQKAIIGAMIESNIHDGRQELESYSGKLRYGVSITDPCIGWDETEELILGAYEQLADAH